MKDPMAAFLNNPRRVLAAVWAISAAYLALFVTRGWIPSDEGLLGQMAERVLQGELPHRDFDGPYTGLLSFWHALAFRLLGLELTSLRWFLFAAALAFVPVVYRIAVRLAPPSAAALVTLFCVVWSVPNYFASMPSWYNLFFAACGLLALVKHVESGRRHWLVAAGLAGGVSFLFKSAGLLFVAAAALFFVYREQLRSEQGPPSRRRTFSLFVTVGLALFAVSLVAVVSARPDPMVIFLFTLPGIGLTAFLLWHEWRRRRAAFGPRFSFLMGMALPFFAGFLVPVVFFLIRYLDGEGLAALARGSFLLSAERVEYSSFPLPHFVTVLAAAPLAALWALPLTARRVASIDRRLLLPAALVLTLALAFASNRHVYQIVWFTIRPAVPILLFAGLVTLSRVRFRREVGAEKRQVVFLSLAVAAMASVVQFPYHWGLYFLYAAPLAALAWLGLYSVQAAAGAPRRLHLSLLAFYFLFALVWLNFGRVQVQGIFFDYRVTSTRLALDRGGLWVELEKADLYERLAREIRRLTPEGSFIYATPDCPEVYFLSGRRNPTRTFFDYFDDDYATPERSARLLALLDERAINVVVLHWNPSFSALPQDFTTAVFERFPNRLPLYPLFTLHWRER